MNKKRKNWISLIFSGLFFILLSFVLITCGKAPTATQSPTPSATPSPTPDRMAEPPLSENPTQLEWGRHLYWLNCMPCHGDHGQGLTDEFRSLWVDDHQNCWARGCHTGREDDQGFPIPRSVPAVISSTGNLPPFATADQLFEYLRTTHPPQHPGYLPQDEYWALTAYLFSENQRLPATQVLGP